MNITDREMMESLISKYYLQIQDLKAEVERFRADAARLDWMEAGKFTVTSWPTDLATDRWCWRVSGRVLQSFGNTLREAIDAAMKGGG